MPNFPALQKTANQLRITALEMISAAKSGHPGGSLSCLDLLVTLYFGGFLRHFPKNPNSLQRDFFVLSKGHASAALYALLAVRGFFPKADLKKFRQIKSHLQGHPTPKTPGVEVATGSLGQGLSFSTGLAVARPDRRVFTLLGDGELQEGQVWEAAMAAAHFKLGNLTALVDANALQIDGPTREVLQTEPIAEKFQAFGWQVQKINGHSFPEIYQALIQSQKKRSQPFCLVAKTIKGYGAPAAEGKYEFHGKPLSPTELAEAKQKLCKVARVK